MENKGYHRLIAWQKADQLALMIYQITAKFPNKFFSLISQMQRAALSVPANIVEGYSRKSGKEKRRFYNLAYSSLTELEYYIEFCYKIKLYSNATLHKLYSVQNETAKILSGLSRSTK